MSSWEKISENSVAKQFDKSSIRDRLSPIPIEFRDFFGVKDMDREDEDIKINLIFQDKQYEAKLYPAGPTASANGQNWFQTRISWDKSFSDLIREKFPQYYEWFLNDEKEKLREVPKMQFTRDVHNSNKYLIDFILPKEHHEESALTNFIVKDELQFVDRYIKSSGFSYDLNLIKNFYLSLKSKPFTILAGTSGTGKSKLIKLFAQSLGATAQNGRFTLIPVRPDWSDSSDLLGYRDLNHTFHPGVLTKVIYKAMKQPQYPFFVCLDEMNLARVEYYLSDLLALMETREREGDVIRTQYIFRDDFFDNEEDQSKYGELIIPQNLYIIGTVNMDETTFPFSKKVLDRANTIEFSQVELDVDFTDFEIEEVPPVPLHNDFLKSEYLGIKECDEFGHVVQDIIRKLKKLNEILIGYNMHFGYRVRDEICYYMIYNNRFKLLDENTAFDYQILQKILPRIQGSMGIKELLLELFQFCTNHSMDGGSELFSDMKKYCDEHKDQINYLQSAYKIAFMMRRVEQDGFTSYWF